MSSVVTTEKDYGYQEALRQIDFVKRNKPFVKVGLQGEEGASPHPNNPEGQRTTLAEVATFNEFGTERIPERSFIRSTMDENRRKLLMENIKLFFQMAAGKMNTERALGILGKKITSLIKRKITTLTTPPNAPITILRKGSGNPLIDTGFMRQSVRDVTVLSGKE
jgi:hypothetical protein